MYITKKGLSEPYEIISRDTGRILFSNEDPDCILAFAQGHLELGFITEDTQQIDLYYRYRKGCRSTAFSALHVSTNRFTVKNSRFTGSIADVFEYCQEKAPATFRITITLNGGFYAFNQKKREAEDIYRAIRP